MNKVMLVGRLTEEPALEERREIQVCEFTVACSRPGSDDADFIDVVAFRKLAELCGKYLVKGQAVAVTGRINVQSYEDRNGVRRKAWKVVADEVEFLSKPANACKDETEETPAAPADRAETTRNESEKPKEEKPKPKEKQEKPKREENPLETAELKVLEARTTQSGTVRAWCESGDGKKTAVFAKNGAGQMLLSAVGKRVSIQHRTLRDTGNLFAVTVEVRE
ncbi:MAG: single-stranded DNA-binding protein [Peptococcaceae bacterium]|nr:single-stranded DNA-binding protein [Peptococcaceae bacterium]